MLKTVICIARLIFDLMCINIKFEKVKRLAKENKIAEHDKLVSIYVKDWAKSVLKVAGVTVSASGLSNIPTDETVLFVCNHQSFFDIPVLLSSLDKPYGLLSKDEVKKIPFITTSDGRTLRYPNPHIKEHDTIKWNLENNEIVDYYKYKIGAHVLIVGGNNIGRTGVIEKIEKHPGSYEIVYIKDSAGKDFSTRLTNIFITGDQRPEIPVEKYNTLLSIIEERKLKGTYKPKEEEESE